MDIKNKIDISNVLLVSLVILFLASDTIGLILSIKNSNWIFIIYDAIMLVLYAILIIKLFTCYRIDNTSKQKISLLKYIMIFLLFMIIYIPIIIVYEVLKAEIVVAIIYALLGLGLIYQLYRERNQYIELKIKEDMSQSPHLN